MRTAVVMLCLALGVVGACGDAVDTAPDAAAPAASGSEHPGVLRLLRDLAPVERSTRVPGEGRGEPVALAPWRRLLERADGAFSMDAVVPDPIDARLDVSALRGLAAVVPASGGEGFALSVGVRRMGGPTEPLELPVAVVVERQELPADDEALLPSAVLDMLDPRKQASHVLVAAPGDELVEGRLEFVTDPSTRALVVYLLAPGKEQAGALVIASCGLSRLRQADLAARGGELRRTAPLAGGCLPEAVTVELDREERQALLAVPPARFLWELPPAEGARRVEASLGVMPREGSLPGAVRFVLEVDGERLLERERRAPASLADAAWDEVSVDLPAGARRVAWITEPVGDDPPIAFVGHPLVVSLAPDSRPRVVLISLDTLRPDRLGCYGAEPSYTPHLDALAEQGLRWRDAYSTSSYTLPSHASLLTGQYPAFHGAVDVTDALDPSHSPMLAELLARAGYLTAGFTGGGYVSTRYGFGAGFDRYSHNDPVWAVDSVRGRQLMETMNWERMPIRPELLRRYDAGAIERWIAAHADGPPFFLFLHTYIAHNYAPDEEWLARLGLLGREGEPDHQKPFNHKERARYNAGESQLRDAVYDQYMPYYDATVGMADAFVGRVVAALGRAGLADDTLLIVTSDHGEEFGEHGFFGHGESLYEPVTRIPFLARLPAAQRGEAGRLVTEPISLVDVAPWILSIVGLLPDPRMAVRAPLGPDRRSPPGRSSFVMELDNHRYRTSAVRDGDHKLVVELGRDGEDFERPVERLYEVAVDPGETRDRLPDEPGPAERLRTMLARFHALAEAVRPRSGGSLDVDALDPEMRRQLEALGYLQGLDERPER